MEKNQIQKIFLVITIIVIWFFNVQLISDLVFANNLPSVEDIIEKDNQERENNLIKRAMELELNIQPTTYTANFETPFRPDKAKRKVRRVPRGIKKEEYKRPALYLKGFLTTKGGLAIIEDEAGKNHIVGVGEKIEDQTIVNIAPDVVKLRDKRGVYELRSEE